MSQGELVGETAPPPIYDESESGKYLGAATQAELESVLSVWGCGKEDQN